MKAPWGYYRAMYERTGSPVHAILGWPPGFFFVAFALFMLFADVMGFGPDQVSR